MRESTAAHSIPSSYNILNHHKQNWTINNVSAIFFVDLIHFYTASVFFPNSTHMTLTNKKLLKWTFCFADNRRVGSKEQVSQFRLPKAAVCGDWRCEDYAIGRPWPWTAAAENRDTRKRTNDTMCEKWQRKPWQWGFPGRCEGFLH